MPWWGWIILGAALLTTEIIAATDLYLIFFAASAFLLALAGVTGFPLSVPSQWLLFAALSIVSLVVFRTRLRRMIKTSEREVDNLTGQFVLAKDAIAPGASGHASFQGTVWAVRNVGDEHITTGDRCRIESTESVVLSVRRAP